MLPDVGSYRPSTSFSIVVLPEPMRPISATRSPAAMRKLTLRSAALLPRVIERDVAKLDRTLQAGRLRNSCSVGPFDRQVHEPVDRRSAVRAWWYRVINGRDLGQRREHASGQQCAGDQAADSQRSSAIR